ncbi:MAG: hypothetical protein UZ21_OP11001000992 [Microgenomates bacterium OLB22]|nr:MAG: hypothetical protein UZ21_OP11001000992 [Microgenomates bacterium OLB22]
MWCAIVFGASAYVLRAPRYLYRTTQVERTESIMLWNGSTIFSTSEVGFVLSSASLGGFDWVRASGGERISLSSQEEKGIGQVVNYVAVPPGTWQLSTRHDMGYEVQTTIFAITPVTVTEACRDREVPCYSLAQTLSPQMNPIITLIIGLLICLPMLLMSKFV